MAFCRDFWYGQIYIVDNLDTPRTLTATISANSVDSTRTNHWILFEIDSTTDGASILTALGASYNKLYVKESSVSLDIKMEVWDTTDNYCKFWVEIPSLTTAEKILIVEADSGAVANPDLESLVDIMIGTEEI